MKTLFDHQIFTIQEYGGISRYFYELIVRFGKSDHNSCDVGLTLTNNAYLNSDTYPGIHPFFSKKHFKGKDRILQTVNHFTSVAKLKTNQYDVFHATYYDPYFLKHVKKPVVVTCLDMIHEKFEDKYESLKKDKTIISNKKQLLKSSDKIIAISSSTKKDIMDIYGIANSKIEVIYLGNSLENKSGVILAKPIVDGGYLLFVGSRPAYKNFNLYLESVAETLKSRKLSFVCAGGGKFTAEELTLINRLGLTNLVKFIPITDEVLTNLYTYAKAFIFPSLYEGFGIPVLEAFSCNCPCLLSEGGSLVEVGGDAAIYFDGTNPDDMAATLNAFLDDVTIGNKLIAKGKERLKLFSWDNTYTETVELYNSLI